MRRKKNNKKTGGAMADAGFFYVLLSCRLYVDQPFSVVESITKFCSGVF